MTPSNAAALPTLFVSHGSPMHALEPGAAGKAWVALGARLGRPRAILIASAHWETRQPALTGSARPGTIHDFSGFPAPLYRLGYPAPGAPEVAARAAALLKDAGYSAAIDGGRGLDHGAWAPLLHMYPRADIPVVQVSLQTPLGTRHHLALGSALAPLAAEGVLVVGSGHMTHNLGDWARQRGAAGEEPYACEFQEWTRAQLASGALDELADYRGRAPHAARAHPTEEHFLPLFVALGAAGGEARAERVYGGIEGRVLAMDAYLFHPPG